MRALGIAVLLCGCSLFDRRDPKQPQKIEPDSAASASVNAEDPSLELSRNPEVPEEVRVTVDPAASEIDFKYKARPLNGIWASAPYLHNGSIPNLAELLKPAAERAGFRVGSLEFDVEHVGYRSSEGTFVFDPALPGNSNQGHDHSAHLSPDERRAVLEYLKSL